MVAALGLGLVVVHRVSGVVNFAHGAMAMYGAYVYSELRATGRLILPVPGDAARLDLGGPLATAPAVTVSLVVAALVGLVVYAAVFRPLRAAPVLAGVVASVGLMAWFQAVVTLRFGSAGRILPTILPAGPVRMAGVALPRDRLYLAALVVVALVVLTVLYTATRFGAASRATAENRVGLALLGRSPDRVAAANWVLASVLATLVGILAGPVTALNPVTFTLLVVPALAAAVVGRMESLAVTAGAGLALGMAQSELLLLQGRWDWLPRTGVREVLPLVVIVVALAVRAGGRAGGRPGYWSDLRVGAGNGARAGRLPAAGAARISAPVVVVPVVVAAIGLLVLGSGYRLGLVTSLVGALICLSVVIVTGWVGQISLAQMALAGVAGFVLTRAGGGWGVPFPLAPLLAAGVAGIVGTAVALPALRLRGTNLAVVTIAAAVAVEEVVFKNPILTGGITGSAVPAPSVGGIDLGPGGRAADFPRPVFGFLVLAVLTATALGAARLRNTSLGLRMVAVRSDERAAAAVGVDGAAVKLAAFGMSASVAGLGGSLLAYSQGRLSYGSFGVFVSLSYLAVTYLGGVGRVSGAVIGGLLVPGGIVFTALDDAAGLGRYQLLLSGLALVVVAVLRPDGMAGGGGPALPGWLRSRFRLPGAAAPADASTRGAGG